jgi:phosphoglycerate dehydrogenase-like enzyme
MSSSGIMGYGAIGRQVARVCKAMGMDVLAYTNRPRDTPESRRDEAYCPPGLGDPLGEFPSKWYSGSDSESIDAFLTADLDLLVLCVPLTPQTTNMIDERRLKLLSGNKTFVSNVGRGPTLNTDALCKALDEGWIRGAALDVTDPEPLPKEHPLWHKKNIIITPHVSGNSVNYGSRLRDVLELNLERLSEGRKLVNVVSRKDGY